MKYEKLYIAEKNKKYRHVLAIRFTPYLMHFSVMNDDTKMAGAKNTAGKIKPDNKKHKDSRCLVHVIQRYIILAKNKKCRLFCNTPFYTV